MEQIKAFDVTGKEIKRGDRVMIVEKCITTPFKNGRFKLGKIFTVVDIRDRIGAVVFFKEYTAYGLDDRKLIIVHE